MRMSLFSLAWPAPIGAGHARLEPVKIVGRDPTGNAINDVHDHPGAKPSRVNLSGDWTDFHAGPPLNLDWI